MLLVFSSNRTFMELKLDIIADNTTSIPCSNRTFMELKSNKQAMICWAEGGF